MSDSINSIKDDFSNTRKIIDAERKKLARELHDGIGGNIVAIKMIVDSTLILATTNPNLVVEKLIYLQSLIDITLKETRRLSNELRSEFIDL